MEPSELDKNKNKTSPILEPEILDEMEEAQEVLELTIANTTSYDADVYSEEPDLRRRLLLRKKGI